MISCFTLIINGGSLVYPSWAISVSFGKETRLLENTTLAIRWFSHSELGIVQSNYESAHEALDTTSELPSLTTNLLAICRKLMALPWMLIGATINLAKLTITNQHIHRFCTDSSCIPHQSVRLGRLSHWVIVRIILQLCPDWYEHQQASTWWDSKAKAPAQKERYSGCTPQFRYGSPYRRRQRSGSWLSPSHVYCWA